MKKWKDGKNRYGLLIDNVEVGVLYYEPTLGFWFTAYLNGGTRDKSLDLQTDNPEDAKIEAEKWLADLYEKYIATLKESIRIHKRYIELLNQTEKET